MKQAIRGASIAAMLLAAAACNEPAANSTMQNEDTTRIKSVAVTGRAGSVWDKMSDSPCIFTNDSSFNCNSPECQAYLCDSVHAITEEEFILRVEQAHTGAFPPAPELAMTRTALRTLLKPVNCEQYHLELQEDNTGSYQLVPVPGAKPSDYNSNSLSVAYMLGVMQLKFDTVQFYKAKAEVESVALRAFVKGTVPRTYWGDLTQLVPITYP